MSSFPWIRMTFFASGLMGIGYGIMRATTPTPEQTYAALAPDLRRKVDANRAARLAQEETMKRQINAQLADPDVQKPVWADPSKPR
ncbi:hypothetical protein SERLA73DRAFT_186510 [Serpula lacrymans var. lacrymans S7.3]|uniref:Cytochrome b mRNA-processing protein 4 n=2 Tax=Serpula lacrymans var. lacrymans TaxID=341189 RepID=F8Q7E1_SERL3|nr:uncharacterized protein SERLADRAFT_398161 [Serpula lacrymans var. lacrymans S7.9]EGN95479.1 hypothetical protein SERLA73DRAFT_186510 [Serpula lacrymans var. lacrymans S7.3]EGO21006.1 hypothetical protein SERLADRAFT_398161 [Serpula lacrymans var. lacrymans S7.9]